MVYQNSNKVSQKKQTQFKIIYPDLSSYKGAIRCLWFSYALDLPYLRKWVLQAIEQAATRKGLDYE